jgi:SOS-response transcriptional repressor LexA
MKLAFAQLLKEEREKKGLSQVELARKAGLTGSYISILEAQRKPPPSDAVIKKLARVFGTDPKPLLSVAHLERTPEDIREHLRQLSGNIKASNKSTGWLAGILSPFSMAIQNTAQKGVFKKGMRHGQEQSAVPPSKPLLPVIQNYNEIPTSLIGKIKTAKWQEIPSDMWKPYRFCVIAPKDDSMYPKIESGDVLIIDPKFVPQSGDLVLICMEKNVYVRKYYATENKDIQLLTFNPDMPPVNLNKNSINTIKGVIVQIIRNFKRG